MPNHEQPFKPSLDGTVPAPPELDADLYYQWDRIATGVPYLARAPTVLQLVMDVLNEVLEAKPDRTGRCGDQDLATDFIIRLRTAFDGVGATGIQLRFQLDGREMIHNLDGGRS